MKHEPIQPAAPLDGAPSTDLVEVLPPERHDGWTRLKQARFLRELAATHCVSAAARAVGMTRQSAYKLRNRLKGEPFDIAWHAAFRRQYDALAEAVIERAIHGVEVPHFHKGELIHTSRRYDERAAVALLALRDRIAAPQPCRYAEDEGIDADDFDTLVARRARQRAVGRSRIPRRGYGRGRGRRRVSGLPGALVPAGARFCRKSVARPGAPQSRENPPFSGVGAG